MSDGPIPPRYQARLLPIEMRRGPDIYGVLDSFAQTFVVGDRVMFRTLLLAERAARQHNLAYERAMTP